MSDMNLPADETADHSGPIVDPDELDDGDNPVPDPASVPPPG